MLLTALMLQSRVFTFKRLCFVVSRYKKALQFPFYFYDFIGFHNVAHFNVIEVFDI
jgi:hypothetical protein